MKIIQKKVSEYQLETFSDYLLVDKKIEEQRFGAQYRFIKKLKGKIKIGQKMERYTFEYYVAYIDKKVGYDLQDIPIVDSYNQN